MNTGILVGIAIKVFKKRKEVNRTGSFFLGYNISE